MVDVSATCDVCEVQASLETAFVVHPDCLDEVFADLRRALELLSAVRDRPESPRLHADVSQFLAKQGL